MEGYYENGLRKDRYDRTPTFYAINNADEREGYVLTSREESTYDRHRSVSIHGRWYGRIDITKYKRDAYSLRYGANPRAGMCPQREDSSELIETETVLSDKTVEIVKPFEDQMVYLNTNN